MVIYLPRSKSDHSACGKEYRAPALSRLCTVNAYLDWIHLAQLTEGAVFPPIDRWGNVGDEALRPGSLVPLVRERFRQARVCDLGERQRVGCEGPDGVRGVEGYPLGHAVY
jgi:hypothetical protein